ncbi:MAG: Crp/Fnr family transcriptional regulator [Janthinobacterium lividum]
MDFGLDGQSPAAKRNGASLFPAKQLEYRNTILRNLSTDSVDRLKLRFVELPLRRPLENSESGIQHIFFIESGVGSMTSTFSDGSEVEVGLFGYESAIGISAFMGVRRSLNRIYMQIEGTGYASKLADAEAEFCLGGTFQQLALRYVQMQLTQATQSAACNAKHDTSQRLARWLLLCSDRAGSTELALSQDFMAIMLGVQRTSVAIGMGRLKRRGVVDYTRGHIRLIHVPALEVEACECYHLLKNHLNNYLQFDTGFVV